MTIQELAKRAGVTPRTIRYYVEQGVLPPPGRGRPAEYSDDHVLRLALIRRLKDQYLPLEEIRETLRGLTMGQLEELLPAPEPPSKEPGVQSHDSATEYIRRVLGRGTVREQLKQHLSSQQTFAEPPSPYPITFDASVPEMQAPRAPASVPIRAPAPQQPLAPPSQPTLTPGQEALWQRITLAPGIELHHLLNLDPRTKQIVERLMEAAHNIVGKLPEN